MDAFVASLMWSGSAGCHDDTTPAGDGDKKISFARELDQDSSADEGIYVAAPAEDGNKDTEDHDCRVHKMAFNMQAFPPGKVVAKNIKIDP